MKEFKTFDQQVSILESRGLIINDLEKIKRILSKENYYNVINGYNDLFICRNSSQYIENCRFEDIYALYLFDRNLRILLFRYLLQIENELRTQVSYVFSKYHPGADYLKMTSFETLNSSHNEDTIKNRAKKIHTLISRLQKDISESITRKDYIDHYIIEHGVIPLWVLVNALPLGRISDFYRLMNQSERIEVSRHWDISEKELGRFIRLLADFRNLCAHDERIYCHRSHYISNNRYHELLDIPKHEDGNYIKGKKDLFALIIIFKILLNSKDFEQAYKSIIDLLNELNQILNTGIFNEILEKMGFPDNHALLLEL